LGCTKLTVGSSSDPLIAINGWVFGTKLGKENMLSCTINYNTHRHFVKDSFKNCSRLHDIYFEAPKMPPRKPEEREITPLAWCIAHWLQLDFGNKYANPLYSANSATNPKRLYFRTTLSDGRRYSLGLPWDRKLVINEAILDAIKAITTDKNILTKYAFSGYNLALLDISSINLLELGTDYKADFELAFIDCIITQAKCSPSAVTRLNLTEASHKLQQVQIVSDNRDNILAPKAFYNCSKLKSIIISNSVTKIGASAFYQCLLMYT
jgi:hypothetical protein